MAVHGGSLTSIDFGLTDKQVAWCRGYLAHGNGTRAAVDAGYSLLDAAKTGSLLKRNPKVRLWLSMQDDSGTLKAKRTKARIEQALWGNHKAAHEGRPVLGKDGDVIATIKDLSASNKALELVGRLNGLFVERQEVRHELSLESIVERVNVARGTRVVDAQESLETVSTGPATLEQPKAATKT
jgi:hypothetical protein